MADKEDVEPTEESAASQSSDAAADREPTNAELAAAAERTGSHAVEPKSGDDFDEIVRDSGIDGEPDDTNGSSHDEKALEPAGVGAVAKGRSAGTAVPEARSARKAKDAATKRRDQPVKVERTGPVKFVKESIGELRKVVYPTGQQLINYFIVVLVFVLFVILYVSLLDLGLGAAVFKIFS